MSTPTYAQIAGNGLWKNNPALVQLLGLCPLLSVTASVVNALGLAVATLFFSGGGRSGHSFFRRLGFSLGDAPAFDGTLRSSSSVPQTARVA